VCVGANPPTTLGEFTFDAYAGMDFYDVSMVDGSNLPMYINTPTPRPPTRSLHRLLQGRLHLGRELPHRDAGHLGRPGRRLQTALRGVRR